MAGAPILVVDDAVTNLKMIRMALTHEGHEVRTAERAEEALEMLSSYRPELILADIQLPGMNGLQMTRIVKENPRTSGIKVLAFTAFVGSETRERAFRAGCDDFICKPIDTSTLAARVRELLTRTGRKQSEFGESTATEDKIYTQVPTPSPMELRFLSDGSEICLQLLNSLKDGFDSNYAREQLHQWAKQGRLFDHPEIRISAERGERLLLQEHGSLSELREVFTDLFLTFAELVQKKVGQVSDSFLQATSGKRIGLIGFTQRQADLICSVLARLKSLPLVFDAVDSADSRAIANCDLAMVHVREETIGSGWLTPNRGDTFAKTLVLLGNRQDLTALPAQIWAQAADFVLETDDPEHLLLRLAFAISRGQRSSPAVPSSAAMTTPIRPRTAVDSPTVILADDDEIIRVLTSSLLKNHGMTCRSATNGLDALRFIRSEQPSVAVLDINMPGMNGFEVLHAIRSANLPCHVMLLTAREREEDIVRGFDLGADDYLVKPFNPFELVARLKRFLR
jgi:two-component system cell cycle response regulator DivK